MLPISIENTLSKLIAVGVGFTTIFIVSGSVTDPVNTPKFLTLGISASLAVGFFVVGLKSSLKDFPLLWFCIASFLVFSLFSLLNSDSPFTQNLYGRYGRNNGFLTYFFLSLILLSSTTLRRRSSFIRVIVSLFVAGFVNLLYCLWVIVFGDFIGWNNPYGNILGTLGNPNFIGSFLGIFVAAYLAFGLGLNSNKIFRISLFLVLPLSLFEIYNSHAIQGRVVGLGGFAIVIFMYLRSRFSKTIVLTYSLSICFVGIFAALGALQIGPFTSFIYKTSVSLRGQYWLAGWNTGANHPISGVGMDAFGDWYRRSRDLHALKLPGVNTVVDASHNVPIDMFAFGGWPLFLSYIAIMVLGAISLFKLVKRIKKYDPILTVLLATWFGYQVQSIISINQIGLAVWGWVLTGCAIAYEKSTREESPISDKTKERKLTRNESSLHSKSMVISLVLGLIGLLLAIPPFTADSKWRSAQASRDVSQVESTMKISYLNPANSMKFLTNIQTLEENNFPNLAHKYAREAVRWNPEAFELWKVFYLISGSTQEEKTIALNNMKRLDPLNPDVTSRT